MNMSNEKRKVNIDEFLVSIDKMLSSKYILIDRKISDVLLAIADTSAVYNLIAECMINFDFNQEWQNATKSNIIKFPDNIQKKISFIFCLLNNLDDRNLDVTWVLDNYFSYDPMHTPYEIFCKTVVEEFRNLILTSLGLNQNKVSNKNDSSNKQISFNDMSDYDDNYRLLIYKLGEMIRLVSSMKKLKAIMEKDDFISVLTSFKQAAVDKRPEYLYAFAVTLNAVAGKNKELKVRIIEIEDIVQTILNGE